MNTSSRLQSSLAAANASFRDENDVSAETTSASERYPGTHAPLLDQASLGQMRIGVIGAGALGNEVVRALGYMGAGWVTIVDPDLVEGGNLAKSVFFREADVGCAKALTLSKALMRAFPATRWDSRVCEIADLGMQELQDCHLLMSCVDTDLARVEIAWTGLALDLPVADGGLGGPNSWHGRVSFFAGRRSACFCCKLSPRKRQEILLTAQAAGQSCWGIQETAVIPSTATMSAITASMQVGMGVRSLLELRQSNETEIPSWTQEVCVGSRVETNRFTTSRSVHCPLHELNLWPRKPLPHPRASAAELLESAGMERIELDWPICIAATCLDCGHAWEPRRRVAWLRRFGSCSCCASRRILEKENIQNLDSSSPWAARPLVDLGLPPHHLYTIRPAGDRELQ